MLENYFHSNGPGAAVVVMSPFRKQICCYGRADLEKGKAIGADTLFELASASKVFTAAAVLVLVERGILQLDSPIRNCLRWMKNLKSHREVTLRDLLQHTSGLRDYLAEGMFTPPERTTLAFLREHIPIWMQDAVPGNQFEYSNTNYVVLAEIIETVTQKAFSDFANEELIKPFGFRNIVVANRPPKNCAQGYANQGFGIPSFNQMEGFPTEVYGDGGLYAGASDLAEWFFQLMTGALIPSKVLMEMCEPGRLDSGEPFNYGLGMQIEVGPEGQRWFGHGGSWVNATTLMGFYPKSQTCVVVLSNEFMAPVARIAQHAFSQFSNNPG